MGPFLTGSQAMLLLRDHTLGTVALANLISSFFLQTLDMGFLMDRHKCDYLEFIHSVAPYCPSIYIKLSHGVQSSKGAKTGT